MNIIDPHPFEHAPDEQHVPDSTAVTSFDAVAVAARVDGWTPERQRQFIEELADCGVVREAAARVGMSEQSAYQLRRRPGAAGFNKAWDAAVYLGVHRLHSTAVERAICGTVKRRYYNGEVVGEETVFDNRLLIYLLGRLDKNKNYATLDIAEDWHNSLEALETGLKTPLPPLDGHKPPVWKAQSGEWFTRFPPPEGFAGDEWYDVTDPQYVRSLTDEERQAIEAHWSQRVRNAEKQRDGYFARLKSEASTAEV